MVSNGDVKYYNSGNIKKAMTACHQGYILSGPLKRVCLSSGKWSGIDTKCQREYST